MNIREPGQHGPLTRLVAATATLSAFLFLPGCGEDLPERNVAVIVGPHVGAPGLLDGSGKAIPALTSALDDVLRGPGALTVIANDGRPRAVRTIDLKYDNRSPQLLKDSYNLNKRHLEDALQASGPVAAQADPAAALKLAGDTVRGKENPEVLAFDNGLSTTGTVLMQLGVIDVGTDVVDLARQSKGILLGSFKDIPVRWHGLCSMEQPQPACSAGVQEQLKKYYEQLVQDAGGTVAFDDAPLAGGVSPTGSRPPVDIVNWRVHRLVANGPSPSPAPSPPVLVKVLTEDSVRFLPNSDEYAERDRAEKAIAALAARLQAAGYPTIHVMGCTAKDPGSTETQMAGRARSRAGTIVRDLQAHKVRAKFVPDGLGWRCPGYREGDHEANRRVIVSSEPVR
ncbi:hypothetical protein GCM10009789_21430 [Kribbella sancticallisti]|uniref:OmpA family protein n=1 Tax=Kribbella sancticallisti TaxID=460087 RepID=A0ABP4NZW5_9ACTN